MEMGGLLKFQFLMLQSQILYDIDDFNSFSPIESGSFSVSFISWATAFRGDNDDNESETFNIFRDNRLIIAKQLAEKNPNFNE